MNKIKCGQDLRPHIFSPCWGRRMKNNMKDGNFEIIKNSWSTAWMLFGFWINSLMGVSLLLNAFKWTPFFNPTRVLIFSYYVSICMCACMYVRVLRPHLAVLWAFTCLCAQVSHLRDCFIDSSWSNQFSFAMCLICCIIFWFLLQILHCLWIIFWCPKESAKAWKWGKEESIYAISLVPITSILPVWRRISSCSNTDDVCTL